MSYTPQVGDCNIEGCDRKRRTRGWCGRHYQRWLAHGDPLGGSTFNGEPLAFYREHVGDKTDDCTLWPYNRGSAGYGLIRLDGKMTSVHILACEQAHGPRPEGLEVRHSCRNKHCFNLRHLGWGTPAENQADRLRDGTSNRGERGSSAILTEDQVRDIRTRYSAGGVTQRKLADEYGVSRENISAITRHRSWNPSCISSPMAPAKWNQWRRDSDYHREVS